MSRSVFVLPHLRRQLARTTPRSTMPSSLMSPCANSTSTSPLVTTLASGVLSRSFRTSSAVEERTTLDLTNADSTLEFARQHIARGVGRAMDWVMVSGSGCDVTDNTGRKFLDFTSGIGVTNTGHCHPTITAAVQKQAATLVHGQANIGFHQPMLELVDKLQHHTPDGLDTFFFVNSGAEAVEGALKLARKATGKPNIITMQGGYHGRTVGTMSLTTSKTVYKAGFGPLMPGVFVTPFPYRTDLEIGNADVYGGTNRFADDEALSHHCLAALRLLLQQQTAPEETAAIFIEPILGEGGYVVPPVSYMKGLRQICDEHNILLVFDEIQCGYGRTGKMFATEHFGVTPDIIIMAKGLASGFPLSAIASTKTLMDKQAPGSMGGTYAGNAVSCAAAIATLEVFEQEKLCQRSTQMGTLLQGKLNDLKERRGEELHIKEIRGLGLMVGMEFDRFKAKGIAGKLVHEAYDRNLLLLAAGAHETMRFVPALVVNEEQVQRTVDIVEESLTAIVGK
eukprot:TRINITY_DN8704_c0_g1_i1.p1 TRINITY_DN8704_c0_g1~~TRINITY_DN8704_c0_g1_i1.p1  ORF type:complete len:551 (-),score=116.71 TRINITY_DN8704_c0_g1_i1:9-1535(-)